MDNNLGVRVKSKIRDEKITLDKNIPIKNKLKTNGLDFIDMLLRKTKIAD